MPVVFIVSREWDLRGAVRAELREAGIAAMGVETVDDMARTIAGGVAPDLVVLDGQYLHRSTNTPSRAKLGLPRAGSGNRLSAESCPAPAGSPTPLQACSSERDCGQGSG